MRIFAGTFAIYKAIQYRKVSPPSLIFRWLVAKWKQDLLICSGLILNPHVVLAAIVGLCLSVISAFLKFLSDKIFDIAKPLIKMETKKYTDEMSQIAQQFNENIRGDK